MNASTFKQIKMSQSIAASGCIDQAADPLQSRDSRSNHVVEGRPATEQEIVVWKNHPVIGQLLGQKNMQGLIDADNIRDSGQFVLAQSSCSRFQLVDGRPRYSPEQVPRPLDRHVPLLHDCEESVDGRLTQTFPGLETAEIWCGVEFIAWSGERRLRSHSQFPR